MTEGAGGTDVAAIVIWLEHHKNRLNGVMGLLSKNSDWMGYPLDCYGYWSTCGAKNHLV